METQEQLIERLTHERNLLGEAIANAAVEAGICRRDILVADLTGPHLLMLADDLAKAAKAARPSFRVHVCTMVESLGTSYMVTVDRADRPLDASALDTEGRFTVFHTNIKEYADADRDEWDTFLNGNW